MLYDVKDAMYLRMFICRYRDVCMYRKLPSSRVPLNLFDNSSAVLYQHSAVTTLANRIVDST
jgi:hypothetical protein